MWTIYIPCTHKQHNETTNNIFHNNMEYMLFIKTALNASCPEILLNAVLCFTSGYIMCHYWHCCKKFYVFFFCCCCCWNNCFILYSDTNDTSLPLWMNCIFDSDSGLTGTSISTSIGFYFSSPKTLDVNKGNGKRTILKQTHFAFFVLKVQFFKLKKRD